MNSRVLAMVWIGLATMLLSAQMVWAAPTIYVDASRPDDSGDGTTWATAKKSIQGGIDAVDNGGTVIVRNGVYTQNATLQISKPVTVKSEIPGVRPKVEVIDSAYAYGVKISANNVTLRDLWIYQGGTATDSAMIHVPKKTNPWPQPGDFQYANISIIDCTLEGGRRAFLGTTENLTVQGSEFKNNYRDSIYLDGIKGTTTILNNNFVGAATSKKAIVVENTSDGPYSVGDLNIMYNTCFGKGQFFLFNNWNAESDKLNINIVHNSIDGTGSSAIVLYPTGSSNTIFDKLDQIVIRDNAITNAGRLAVYVDYAYYTGTDVPEDGAILLHRNLAWNNTVGSGDTVDPTGNYGFSSGAPAGTTLAMFNLLNNLVADPLWADPTHANNNFEFLPGSPLYLSASDGTNIGAWQGGTEVIPEPQSVLIWCGLACAGFYLWRHRGPKKK